MSAIPNNLRKQIIQQTLHPKGGVKLPEHLPQYCPTCGSPITYPSTSNTPTGVVDEFIESIAKGPSEVKQNTLRARQGTKTNTNTLLTPLQKVFETKAVAEEEGAVLDSSVRREVIGHTDPRAVSKILGGLFKR